MIRFIILFTMFVFSAEVSRPDAASLEARIVPGFPTENDSAAVHMFFSAPMGIEFLESSVVRSGDTIHVVVSYNKTCGGETNPCLPGLDFKRSGLASADYRKADIHFFLPSVRSGWYSAACRHAIRYRLIRWPTR